MEFRGQVTMEHVRVPIEPVQKGDGSFDFRPVTEVSDPPELAFQLRAGFVAGIADRGLVPFKRDGTLGDWRCSSGSRATCRGRVRRGGTSATDSGWGDRGRACQCSIGAGQRIGRRGGGGWNSGRPTGRSRGSSAPTSTRGCPTTSRSPTTGTAACGRVSSAQFSDVPEQFHRYPMFHPVSHGWPRIVGEWDR